MNHVDTVYVIAMCVVFYVGVLHGRSTAGDDKWFKMWSEADTRADKHFRMWMATQAELDQVLSERDDPAY